MSVVFFCEIADDVTPRTVGPAFVAAFQHALWWVTAVFVLIFAAMFLLPRRPKQHTEA